MLDNNRLSRVLDKLHVSGADQMIVTDPVAIFYLTGKWIFPGERFLGLYIAKGQTPVLFINELFRFEEEIGVTKRYITDTDSVVAVVKDTVNAAAPLGVDKIMPARFLLPMIEGHIATGFVNTSISIDECRAIKDAREIELMRAASKANDMAMDKFKGLLQTGLTEVEVAAQMLDIYKSFGASRHSFEPIVAFGKNAADPHHMPDETRLKEGDEVLFDVGCVVNDYCSDMTRTFFWKGQPSEKATLVYNLVRKANESAEQMCKPGIKLCDIDKCARDIITDGGYGKDFTHRLGHFIGIEDHDYGDVSSANENLTQVGNCFSIEPGIYVVGEVGVRIEDLVLITQNGVEVLNQYSKEIEVLG